MIIHAIRVLLLLLLLLLPSHYSWACHCDNNPEPLYKGFSLKRDTGYFVREFDKNAPTPGVDWTGDAVDWICNARAKGWITNTSIEGIKAGALLIGYQYPTGVWVGIARNITDSTVSYETFNSKNKSVFMIVEIPSLKRELLGYILPEKQLSQTAKALAL